MGKKKYYFTAILGAFSGVNVASGLDNIIKHYSAINSIRDAVYAHADKITPEIIEQANQLVSKVSDKELYCAMINLGAAGFVAGCAYVLARAKEE